MKSMEELLHELGVSKVRLAKYLGVSRQMIYNYLDTDDISKWPSDKRIKIFELLNVKTAKEIENLKIDADYIMEVESKLNQGVKKIQTLESVRDLDDLGKKERKIINDITYLLKEKITDDKTDETYNICKYIYHLLQSVETDDKLKSMVAYVSKAAGFTKPTTFVFDESEQFVFESIMHSAMNLYSSGGYSKPKLVESHQRFVREIEQKNEEKLSRTQELNSAKVTALKELGYTSISESNASEVWRKIAEIQARKVS